MNIVICQGENFNQSVINTHKCLNSLGTGWFVYLAPTYDDYLLAEDWALDKTDVLVVPYSKLVHSSLDLTLVESIYSGVDWFTQVHAGVLPSKEYFKALDKAKKEKTIGAFGALGYFIHGNWEGLNGIEVLPNHLSHTLDSRLWSWKRSSYIPPSDICIKPLEHIDHQFYLHSLGLNLLTSPSDVAYIPENYDFDSNLTVAIAALEKKWRGSLDFLKTSEVSV